MEPKNMLELVVGIAVGILVLSAALFPVIDEVTKTTDTFENDRAFYVTNVAPYTLTYADGVLTVNDVVMNPALTSEYSLVFSDQFAVRNYGGTLTKLVTLADINNVSASGSFLTSLEIDENLHAVITRDVAGTPTESEFDLEYFWGITSEKTNQIMTTGAKPIYVDADDEIFTVGRTNVTAWSNTFEVRGSIEDGPTAVVIRPPTGITITDEAIDYASVDNHDGYTINKITFLGNTTEITYNRMVAPASVTFEILDPTLDSDERDIIEVIPLLIIVGLIMGIVGMIASRRLE